MNAGTTPQRSGLRTFSIIWAGQVVSVLGTGMTRFALLIWAYQLTGQATTLALLGFFSYVTYVLASPLAGVWVDRWDRRKVMLFSDLGAGLITAGFLLLYQRGELQIWHLYLGEALTGVFESFQRPAYNVAMTLLVPREHLTRAAGLRSLGWEGSRILAPAFGGVLLTQGGLGSVMLVDIATVSAAVLTLLLVRVPRPALSTAGEQAQRLSLPQQMAFGLRYITQRRGLLGLLGIYMLIHFFAALTYFGVLPAMILARSGGDELVLSMVQSALGVGGVIGGALVAIWGGPRRRIHGVLTFCGLSFLLGDMCFALGQSPLMWVVAALVAAVFIPFIGAANTAIWQSKVPPDVQGRVLSTAMALQQATLPLGYLLTGPLADRVMEPGMQPGGALAGVFGPLVGVGPGAGMAAMFLFTAVFGAAACFGAYLYRPLRNVESELPDYDDDPPASADPAGAAVAAGAAGAK